MIFVDTNVFMYAVGRDHPLKAQARAVFEQAIAEPGKPLVTSAEVLQELLHVYLPVNRLQTLNHALELVARSVREVWSVEPDDVLEAIRLTESNPALGARDLIHLACCQRRGIRNIRTFDRALNSAFAKT
ncbi:MAG: VapC toxin family PIN domain ribonuclease [Xanthomonadales bacterium]|nr:VapC toxin family PIN domain ribonuclease [Xanthomonadales bacterium]